MGLGPAQVFQPFIKNKDMIKIAVFPANLTLVRISEFYEIFNFLS